LSEGKLDGDDIVCPYHGFRYDPRGICVHIPTQSAVPGRTKVRAYTVRESAPFVWIWMGEETPAVDIPATLPWAADPSWTFVKGSLPVNCNYMLVQENVLDLTHFPHLHATTLEQPGWDTPPAELALENGRVGYRHVFDGVKLAPWQAIPTGIGSDRPVKRTDWGEFVSPAIHVAGIDIVDPAPVNGRTEFASRIVHATTPESPQRSHYWWCISQNYAVDDEAGKAAVKRIIDATFAQDKHLLEIIQDTILRDHQHDRAPEVSVEADRQGLQARKVLRSVLGKT
jgi:vanillate O-demethylase monooxygenase subunit